MAKDEQEKEKATNILDENISINEANEKAKVNAEQCKNNSVETARFEDLDQHLAIGNEQDLAKDLTISKKLIEPEKLIDNEDNKDSNRVDQNLVNFAVQLIENVFNDLQVFLENNTVVVYSNDIKSHLGHEIELYGQHHQGIEVM